MDNHISCNMDGAQDFQQFTFEFQYSIIVDVICDFSLSIISKTPNIMFTDYEFHVFSIIVITLLITTFLGYLAQMSIDLK